MAHRRAPGRTPRAALRALNKPTNRDYWTTWISAGKTNTLMPAFAASQGGPLQPAQIKQIVDYLEGPFKTATPPAGQIAHGQ